MRLTFCKMCRRQLDEIPELPFEERKFCPECGSRMRVYEELSNILECKGCGDSVHPQIYKENDGYCEICVKNVPQVGETSKDK